MRFSSQSFAFDIPDEWWEAVGMEAFATSRWTYRRHPPAAALLNVILSVNEIGVTPRGHDVPDFKQDCMVSVLNAFSRELALPPIEVVETNWNGYRYWLYHGRHRLAASIAVGFLVVPAVIVRSIDEITRTRKDTTCTSLKDPLQSLGDWRG